MLLVGLLVTGQMGGLSKGLWLDEYASISFAEDPLFVDRASRYNTPPTYFLLVRVARAVGLEEPGLRALSLLFSAVALGLLFLTLAAEFGGPSAMVVALWVGSRPSILFHSAEIRPYPLLWLFLAIGLWGARCLPSDSKSTWPWWLALVGVITTHAIGLLCVPVLLALRIEKFGYCRLANRTIGISFCLGGMCLGLLYWSHLGKTWWADSHLQLGWGRHLAAILGYDNSLWHWPALLPLLGIAGGRLRLWGIAVLYFLLVLVVSHTFTAILLQRTLTPLLFFLAVPLTHSLFQLGKARTLAFVLLALTVIDTHRVYQRANLFPRMPLKSAEMYLRQTTRPGDFLVLSWYAYNQNIGTFYGAYSKSHLVRLPREESEYSPALEGILERARTTPLFRVLLPEPWLVEGPGRRLVADLRQRFATRQLHWGQLEVLEVFPSHPKEVLPPLTLQAATLGQDLLTQDIN